MEGTENSDEIIAAIGAYHATHTPEQTEKAVRLWYERYDEILKAAIENGMEMQSLRNANSSNSYQLCSEGQTQDCRAHQIAAQRSAPGDQAQMQKNFDAESRIQQAFMRIRNALWMHNLRYPWFKVRTTNGIDRF
jgi:NH3-dependent NAD+ synthetase